MTTSADYGELVARAIENEWHEAGWPPARRDARVRELLAELVELLHREIPT